jgi:hypothetical protein
MVLIAQSKQQENMIMNKAPGTSKRTTRGALGTKGIAKNNIKGKAKPLRTTRATMAKKRG